MLRNEYIKRTFKHCGKGVRIYGKFHITSPENMDVGNNVHINTNAFIRAEGGLFIGDNTHISKNLVLYTMNHQYEGEYLPYDAGRILKPVHIGRNVWVGMNVVIIPGITIGDGAIIGIGTVVTHDVAPLEIIGSQSHRVIKLRDAQRYESMDKTRIYGGMSGYPWQERM